jgi:hypothetical protein
LADCEYALFGHPVSHSRSPDIHHAFAEQTGERVRYELIDVVPEAFESELRAFLDRGGLGGSVDSASIGPDIVMTQHQDANDGPSIGLTFAVSYEAFI